MTDKPPITEQGSQVVVALAIVGAMVVLGVGLLIYGYEAKDGTAAMGGVGAIVGALATALNAPNGVSTALATLRKPGANVPPPSPPDDPA